MTQAVQWQEIRDLIPAVDQKSVTNLLTGQTSPNLPVRFLDFIILKAKESIACLITIYVQRFDHSDCWVLLHLLRRRKNKQIMVISGWGMCANRLPGIHLFYLPPCQLIRAWGRQSEIGALHYCVQLFFLPLSIFTESIFPCCRYLLLDLYLFSAAILHPSCHLSPQPIYLCCLWPAS